MTNNPASHTPPLRLLCAILLTGLLAGLVGICLSLIMHGLQHFAYGYESDQLIGEESFLQGVSSAPAWRRLLVVWLAGVVAGTGWYLIRRWMARVMSVRQALAAPSPRLPVGATLANSLLQIITVALGSPLGREVAPREISAMLAGRLNHRLGLTLEDQRILFACAAGAGLAAVYNVPLSGALMTLEVLLGSFALSSVMPALATSVIATVLSWSVLGDTTPYPVPDLSLSAPLLIWAMLFGPLFGLAGYGFGRLTAHAQSNAVTGHSLLWIAPLAFAVIGLASMVCPALLGNGKAAVQLSFANQLGFGLAASLLLLRLLVVWLALRSGATGGLLTPGFAMGALLATMIGYGWNLYFPDLPLTGLSIIGAAAFLASSSRMPLTAVALIVEFTHMPHDFLVAVLIAVTGSAWVCQRCQAIWPQGNRP